MNITELANLSGVSRPYLSQIESGKRKPSRDILKNIAIGLKTDYYELLHQAGHLTDDEYKHIKDGGLIVRSVGEETYRFITHHLDRILKNEGDEWTSVIVKYDKKELSKSDKDKIIKFIENFIVGEE